MFLVFFVCGNRVPFWRNRFPVPSAQQIVIHHVQEPSSTFWEPVPQFIFSNFCNVTYREPGFWFKGTGSHVNFFKNSDFFSFFKRYLFIFYSCILPYKITICKGVLEAIYFRFFRIYFFTSFIQIIQTIQVSISFTKNIKCPYFIFI